LGALVKTRTSEFWAVVEALLSSRLTKRELQ